MASVPLNYYDFLETFPLPGCVICNMVKRDVDRFLDSHLYEYVNTPQTHAALRASRGLCATHSAELVEYGASVLGIAILQASVLDEVLKITAAAPSPAGALGRLWGGKNGGTVADKLEPEGPCLACAALERSEKQHLLTLASHTDDARLQAAYRASAGLCLPHFRAALRRANPTQHDMLLALQVPIWQRLKSELDMFADKYDINHADEAMGAEGDSWRRAIRLISGAASIFGLRIR